jgi:hypothetical protein
MADNKPSTTVIDGDTIKFDSLEDMMAMRPSGQDSPWHWLSFADPDLPKGTQFLGVAIVQAGSFLGALSDCNQRGINPGGEVNGVEIPPEHVPPEHLRNRLLSMADLVKANLL